MENINDIIASEKEPVDRAIALCLYVMKTQIFLDGNKRASVIFANHYLIGKGQGLLVIPFQSVSRFKKLLIAYYEGKDIVSIQKFFKRRMLEKMII
ncbi:MAG: Fic family protein [Bacillus subtilis]|nr:Fic family protein [Bacillus subtilis]